MYTKKSHIHFIGIGGIGMSGIATILKLQGYIVSGCDPDITQDTITQLQKLHIPVYHGNNAAQCDDHSVDFLVYIPMYATTISAVAQEIARARSRNIPTISRAQMLNELMRTKYSIAVAGSHGKTTTTSLLSHILIESNLDPTVVIGGELKSISSNIRLGNGNFLVAEADESDRSFLQLFPTFSIITNIDLEHLETYKDLDDIKQAFIQFINYIPFYGKAIICIDDENIRSLLMDIQNIPIITYGIEKTNDTNIPTLFDSLPGMGPQSELHKDWGYDFHAKDIILHTDHSLFTVFKKNEKEPLTHITLPIAGKHNIYNCLAAIAIAYELEIPIQTIAQHIKTFSGVDRRFTFRGLYKGAEIFDDYGHHPEEIKNTLLVARKRVKNKLIVIFQPHRYTRTQKLWQNFIDIFFKSGIDTLIITDIHSAGEAPIDGVTSKDLVMAMKKQNTSFGVHYVPFTDNFAHIKNAIDESIAHNDLVLLLGAGKVYHIAQEIVE